jgi:hypothetical protein
VLCINVCGVVYPAFASAPKSVREKQFFTPVKKNTNFCQMQKTISLIKIEENFRAKV